ncbi:MAG: hypothetical protein Q4F95_01910 [Oscillospiraceae bacterium]|nr:hypothetical protein [Oscillospiraceae bacterium]
MNAVISELESIITDLGFSGIKDSTGDILLKLERVNLLCSDLDMKHLGSITVQLKESLINNDAKRSCELLCRLSMYTSLLSQNG